MSLPKKADRQRGALGLSKLFVAGFVFLLATQCTGQNGESTSQVTKNMSMGGLNIQATHGGTVRMSSASLSEWLLHLEEQHLQLMQEQEGVTPALPRGDGQKIYKKVAPSVVAVRTWLGHGTGFLVDREGLVLTNYHVVHGGTFVDAEIPASFAWVHMGKMLDSGRMERLPEVRATLLDVDPARDLALLRLQEIPEGVDRLPRIELANRGPRPGQECSIIGHPSSGMLWTYREGLVSALGQSPHDIVNVLLPLLDTEGEERAQAEAALDSMQSFDIVLSSCLANPGDSGGPLVDKNGRLIGITFALPGDPAEQKFTYHIALAEVRAFLEQANHEPTLLVPEAWQIGPMVQIAQRNVVVGGGQQWRQLLLDVDMDTPVELLQQENFGELLGAQRFDAEVALHAYPGRRLAFYDTRNDGQMDVILVDHDADDAADIRYRLDTQGRWHLDGNINAQWLDPSLCGPLEKSVRELLAALNITG